MCATMGILFSRDPAIQDTDHRSSPTVCGMEELQRILMRILTYRPVCWR